MGWIRVCPSIDFFVFYNPEGVLSPRFCELGEQLPATYNNITDSGTRFPVVVCGLRVDRERKTVGHNYGGNVAGARLYAAYVVLG